MLRIVPALAACLGAWPEVVDLDERIAHAIMRVLTVRPTMTGALDELVAAVSNGESPSADRLRAADALVRWVSACTAPPPPPPSPSPGRTRPRAPAWAGRYVVVPQGAPAEGCVVGCTCPAPIVYSRDRIGSLPLRRERGGGTLVVVNEERRWKWGRFMPVWLSQRAYQALGSGAYENCVMVVFVRTLDVREMSDADAQTWAATLEERMLSRATEISPALRGFAVVVVRGAPPYGSGHGPQRSSTASWAAPVVHGTRLRERQREQTPSCESPRAQRVCLGLHGGGGFA